MPSRWDIKHTTDIDAPIDLAWDHLIDINHWDWNLWTRLEATDVKAGTKGKLKANYKGDNEGWDTYDFEFGPIDEEDHIMTWFGKIGPGGCLFSAYHTMQLQKVDDRTTRLVHKESFRGLLPALGLGLPFKQLNENYLKMNEAFKIYVEAKA
jgi:hypothetical protein